MRGAWGVMAGSLRIAAVAALGLLAGCSGDFFSDPPTLDLPANGTVEVLGQNRSAAFTGSIIGRTVNLEPPSAPSGGSLVFETVSGQIVALTILDGNERITFDARDGDLLLADGSLIGFSTPRGGSQVYLFDPQNDRFEHQTYGIWFTGGLQGAGQTGAGTYGPFRTPSENMPPARSQTAVYNGSSLGWVEESGAFGLVTANVRAETNFQDMDFEISDSVVTILDEAGSPVTPTPDSRLDLSGQLVVSGAAFAGVLNGAGGTVLSGTVLGNFYGPSANEIGGTFAVSNPTINYYGSFGAAN